MQLPFHQRLPAILFQLMLETAAGPTGNSVKGVMSGNGRRLIRIAAATTLTKPRKRRPTHTGTCIRGRIGAHALRSLRRPHACVMVLNLGMYPFGSLTQDEPLSRCVLAVATNARRLITQAHTGEIAEAAALIPKLRRPPPCHGGEGS